jgi:2-polyprenyl-3-methyl-5-hydroxy-6-metoxy-1,4-benzoquinol methylase
MTDWGKIEIYGSFIEKDPFRMGLHYPAVQQEVGTAKKRILDVGCGDGLFARLLAAQGACVVGYDRSPERIAEAKENKDAQRLGVKYVVATPSTFASQGLFDAATSVMVLNFATSLGELEAFFHSTRKHLVAGGRFISIVLNPSFSAFGKDFIVRRITKLHGNNVRMEFCDDDSRVAKMTAVQHQYTKEELERAALQGGMTPEPWKKIFATPSAVAKLGEGFWQLCHEAQPYALFVARKA